MARSLERRAPLCETRRRVFTPRGRDPLADLERTLEDALRHLGADVLRAPGNAALREGLASRAVEPRSFARELLLLTLRLAVLRAAAPRSFDPERSAGEVARCLEGRLPWTSRPIALALDAGALDAAVEVVRAFDEGVTLDALAAAYESLIEREPAVTVDPCAVTLRPATGHERRSTGSYYTPAPLTERLLDGALEPALDEALGRGDLAGLTVCDPACGAGSLLVAAARRIARRLGVAVRDVIGRQVYGVDRNPVAAELCAAALWLEGQGEGAWTLPAGRVVCGDALLGATRAMMAGGIPDGAFDARDGDDADVASSLRRRNREERREALAEDLPWRDEALLADAWCAALLMEKTRDSLPDAITEGVWRALRRDPSRMPASMRARVDRLRAAHGLVHWHLAFADVFTARGGFDVVLGNPPWIAHAGRASQPLAGGVRRFLERANPAFHGYRTTHGAFVHASASIAAPGGAVGLILPTSVADLDGYRAVREAHDRACAVRGELESFGDGAFEGVFQPCMALVSTRRLAPEASSGAPWPLRRDDVDEVSRRLLARLAAAPTLPREVFGERGLQTDAALRERLVRDPAAAGEGAVALREGKDVGEFRLGPPKLWARAADVAGRLRGADEFRAVSAVVRQTARYPIAAVSDGIAFRNTLLAVFARAPWTAHALVALLNSSLVRWHHHARFRDAREGMPQVKVGHLRAVPAPPEGAAARLAEVGARLSARNEGVTDDERRALDEVTFELYGLDEGEREAVRRWARAMPR